MITVACVRAGTKYGPEYVERLRNMVSRNSRQDIRFVCLTDQDDKIDDVHNMDIRLCGLSGWWAKMALFNPHWRKGNRGRVIYFDLDTVLTGPIDQLLDYNGEFAICQNFTTLAGHQNWSRYGSCVMSFPPVWGGSVWSCFAEQKDDWIEKSGNRGDQEVVGHLVPNAVYLQDVLPKGFFLHYRQIGPAKPDGCSAVIFGGNITPANCPIEWVKGEWR